MDPSNYITLIYWLAVRLWGGKKKKKKKFKLYQGISKSQNSERIGRISVLLQSHWHNSFLPLDSHPYSQGSSIATNAA